MCVSGSASSFATELRVDELDAETICFSYTPVDDFHVHNANLFVAEFLARVGKELGRAKWVRLGERAAHYALVEQNPDGSLYYWGRVQNAYAPNHRDHYHSGFEIRALVGLWRSTGREEYRQAARRYFEFYCEQFWARVDNQLVPKMTPASLYPIDIHSCAEALLCVATLSSEFPQARAMLPGVADWICKTMQTPEGWFIYMIYGPAWARATGRNPLPALGAGLDVAGTERVVAGGFVVPART